MFESLTIREARSMVLIKRVLKLMVGVYLIIGLTAGYRAWFQIKSLEVRSTDSVLRRGSTIETTVVSYARVPIEVRLELIQGTHSETFALQRVPKNTWAFLDPRTREASQTAVLAADVLDRFAPGEARVRATATGGLQLGHLPPPLTREVAVKIERK
jgi:hypothetical protein